ncbi:glucosaminidase domain-containing protein [Vibrio sp. V03_P4A6T147]|uniref:glucosaminidase domain-containing protein n=1 Tax=Vibrio sp. V03_P4A6T147 TaxID=1938658 RepID=UPI000B8EA5C5|nr:glucosaminidase [Vibrio sp. V03_P4A6T147]
MRKIILLTAISLVVVSCSVYYVKQTSTETTYKSDIPSLQGARAVGKAPDFSAIDDVNEKKHAFFSFLKPGIAWENLRVLREREILERIAQHHLSNQIAKSDYSEAQKLSKRYEVPIPAEGITSAWLENMLHRVDVLPEALVLTQAANESAWGTSRFAIEGNNYFGQWCYSVGCGLVPLQRVEGMTHEVASFGSVQESIHGYFMNVNRNSAYHDLREIRFRLRKNNADLLSADSAMEMTNGLLKYSERGEAYVQDLQSMMRHNQPFWTE